jgi:hypothetical protein
VTTAGDDLVVVGDELDAGLLCDGAALRRFLYWGSRRLMLLTRSIVLSKDAISPMPVTSA